MEGGARILGIDLGIASLGWGVIEVGGGGKIIATGVRCFDAPLIDKTGEPKSAARRAARGQRRVIRRRRQRMNAVRTLLHNHGLLPDSGDNALALALRRVSPAGQGRQVTPWALRSIAYERALDCDEFAIVLGHIARHRGFRSNSKRESNTNAADETSKMKKAMEQTREGLARYRSFGDMLAQDPAFSVRKRNRDKDYSHTAKRSDLEDEVRLLFAEQRRRGNTHATPELETKFADIAFSQRPLQDSEDKVGPCPFEPSEKRTARRAPSFEMFRFLSKLATLTISVGRAERRLSPDEIRTAASKLGHQKSITFKTLRGLLDLDPNARFAGVARDKEGMDVAARAGAAAAGTYVLRSTLGESAWASLMRTPEKLDRIAEILSFREDFTSIRKGLEDIGLEPLIVDQLAAATEKGAFVDFSGAAHVSAKAARNILGGLREGLVYSEACQRAGYDHTARAAVSLDQINSPVTRRAFGEAIKQVRAVGREHGPFDAIHIELARDVGKSADERKKLERGIEERNAEKDKRKAQAQAILGRSPSDDELLRYELALEQAFKCVYCDGSIAPAGFAGNQGHYQVDHILPWSRFGDDSYLNKTLCCAKCNQDKRGRTTFEWFREDRPDQEWELLGARLDTLKEMKGLKKRNFRLRDSTEEVENRFKARNLTDTRWATRLLADELKRMFPIGKSERRVFTRPGAITSKLRRAWGLAELKKINGERVADDRHHAVDALVLAATTESLLQNMTREIQRREKEGKQDDIFHVQQPWPGFRLDVATAVYGKNGSGGVFISRAERRRARGKAHDATVKQIKERDGETLIYERKSIDKLTDKDLLRIKDADRNHKLVSVLRGWLDAGKPKDRPPKWKYANGDGTAREEPIRKVRLLTKDQPAVLLNGGTVDRGDMARVDVFQKKNKKGKWEFYVVPIYPHQIATMFSAPDRAVKGGGGDEAEWYLVDSSYDFLWSLYSNSLIEITKPDGESIEGYFRSLDRNTGAFTLSPHVTAAEIRKGIGVKTLLSLRKFSVDRLGRRFEVSREVRTWRGKACT